MIRRIRDLLYDQGFTISGARNKMQEVMQLERDKRKNGEVLLDGVEVIESGDTDLAELADFSDSEIEGLSGEDGGPLMMVRRELSEIRELLSAAY
jgi:hypothetical protein